MSERIHPKVDGCPVDIQAREPLADGMPAIATASICNEMKGQISGNICGNYDLNWYKLTEH